MDRLGWGVIGIGRVADTWMAPAINADPRSRIVEVVSRDQARADAFAGKHGGTGSTSFEHLLANEEVDVVLVTTPNAFHVEQVVAVARAGKHVYCDKPLGLTVAEAARAVDECAGAGVKLGMNFQTRHHECFEVARELVSQDGIGTIQLVQLDMGNGGRRPSGWRLDASVAGLGVVNNLAVHLLDLLRYLLDDEVVEVATMFDTGGEEAIELLALVLLRFSKGTLAYASANQVIPNPLNEIALYGTEGRIDGQGITRLGSTGTMRVLTRAGETVREYSSMDCYERSVAAFTQAVLQGRDPSPAGADGLRSVELTEAIARSARERRTVQLSGD